MRECSLYFWDEVSKEWNNILKVWIDFKVDMRLLKIHSKNVFQMYTLTLII